jgi:hypothetical protein
MRFSTQIKPIGYVKAHAAEFLDRIAEERAVPMDVSSCDETMEPLALLELLIMADKEIEGGETVPIEDVMAEFGVEAERVQCPPQ